MHNKHETKPREMIMMSRKLISRLTLLTSLSCINPAYANDDLPGASFAEPDAYTAVSNTIDTMTTWADAEYIEHEVEGLFERHPEDGQVTQATIEIAKELKNLARSAQQTGNAIKARAYYFAAEATARYSVQMPHMLEERVEKLSQRQ